MNKIMVMVVAILGTSMLGGCLEEKTQKNSVETINNEIDNSKKNVDTSQEEEVNAIQVPEVNTKTEGVVGDVIILNGMEIQVVDIMKSNGGEFSLLEEGNEFIIVDVVIRNTSDKQQHYNEFDFKLQNSNGQIKDVTFMLADNDNKLGSGEISPGGAVRGTISFEEKKGQEELILIYENNMFTEEQVKVHLMQSLENFEIIEGNSIVNSDELPGVQEAVVHSGTQITVKSVSKSPGNDWNKPQEGNEFIIVELEIVNVGDKNITYNPFDYSIRDSKGKITKSVLTLGDNDLNSGELAPGGNVTGNITFEVLVDDSALALIYEPNMFLEEKVEIRLN